MLFNTGMADTRQYTFVKTHRVDKTKRECSSRMPPGPLWPGAGVSCFSVGIRPGVS